MVRILLLLGFLGWSWWNMQGAGTPPSPVPPGRDLDPSPAFPAAVAPGTPAAQVSATSLLDAIASFQAVGARCGVNGVTITLTVGRLGLQRLHTEGALTDAAAGCLFDGARAPPWPTGEQETQVSFDLTSTASPIQ